MFRFFEGLGSFVMATFLTILPVLVGSLAYTHYPKLTVFTVVTYFLATILHVSFVDGYKKSLSNIGTYFKRMAYVMDLFWAAIYGPMLNVLLCNWTVGYYPFGVPGETVSSACGKNIVGVGYTNTGYPNSNKIFRIFANSIDRFFSFVFGEDNHCVKHINNKV